MMLVSYPYLDLLKIFKMLGKSETYSPKWCFFMVIDHCKKSQKITNKTNPNVLLTMLINGLYGGYI